MHLLETETEIRAAVAMMNPVARVASQRLSEYLFEKPAILETPEACEARFFDACIAAMQMAGWDPSDRQRIGEFLENHGDGIRNVAVSVVVFAANDAKRRQRWGWLGKAGMLIGAAVLGSVFG